jgi:hypothetical protein
VETTTTTTLPGEPFDIYPPKDAVMVVIGVAHDDVLNVRESPGLTTIIATLGPLADVVSAGEGWKLTTSIWWKVTVDGRPGWVNSRYLAYPGDVVDLTSLVVERYGGYPAAEEMAELGEVVAETLAPGDPPATIVMTASPGLGDLGEVTYDLVGIGDDVLRGLRLHVFGAPQDGGFTLKSVEALELCARSVDCA